MLYELESEDAMSESTVPTGGRHWRLPAAVLTTVGVMSSSACASGGDDPEEPPPVTVASPTGPALTCGATAPDGTTIDVVESGFTMVNDPDEDPEVSYGTVLENTSTDYLAILTLVVVQLTDVDGDHAIDVLRNPPSAPAQAVQTIFPGQRVGIGDQVYVDRGDIEEISVDVRESLWLPIEQVEHVGEATATDIDFERIRVRNARIEFHIDPAVDPRQHRDTSESISDAQSWAIFRDADDAVVGGMIGPPGNSFRDPDQRGPNDPITDFVGVSRVPDGAVDAKTEIYVSPVHPAHRDRPC